MCQPTILNKANASNLDWFEQPETVSKSFTLEGHEYTDMGAAEVARPLFACELLTWAESESSTYASHTQVSSTVSSGRRCL